MTSTVADPAERLASFWRFLADAEFHDYCPLYARIGHAIADDAGVIAQLVGITNEEKIEPVLCLAAMKYLASADPGSTLAHIYGGVADTDPWPPFRALLLERFDEVAALMQTRTIQTNEVGRAAFIAPMLALAHLHTGGAPLHLIEIGSSAGLNLFLDRFHIDYGDSGTCGPPGSAVQLRCDVLGSRGTGTTTGTRMPPMPTTVPTMPTTVPTMPPMPTMPTTVPTMPPMPTTVPTMPTTVPTIARRLGIDISPLDVTDPDHVAWLEACIWPRLTDRLARFRAAVEVSRVDPPRLLAGNAVDLLPAAIAEAAPDVTPVVVATWVLAYLSVGERTELGRILADAAAATGRTIAAVTGEYPSVVPWIATPDRQASVNDPRGASLLGLGIWAGQATTTAPVAWVQAHGRWIDWLEMTPFA